MTFLTTLWLLTNAGDDDRGIKKNGHERSIRTNCGSALLGGGRPPLIVHLLLKLGICTDTFKNQYITERLNLSDSPVLLVTYRDKDTRSVTRLV